MAVIIDIHVHLPRGVSATSNLDELVPATEQMLAAGRKLGIQKQVILGLDKSDEANELLAALARRFPDEIIPFMRGSFIDPDAVARLERGVKEQGFKGLKLYGEPPDFPLSGLLGGHALYRKAAELDVPVLLHSWHAEEGLADVMGKLHNSYFPMLILDDLGKRHPGTTFIIAHVGGMWVKAFQAARPYPNIHFDVSGFDPERGIVEKAVAMLGPERVLWGSDAPGRNYAAQFAKVRYAEVSDADKRLIFGENAARLLRLS